MTINVITPEMVKHSLLNCLMNINFRLGEVKIEWAAQYVNLSIIGEAAIVIKDSNIFCVGFDVSAHYCQSF